MDNLFHIERSRWEHIVAQGYPLGSIERKVATDLANDPTMTAYHFTEDGVCVRCGAITDGLVAETPAELETAKEKRLRNG